MNFLKIKNRFTKLIVNTYYDESIYTSIIDLLVVLIVSTVLIFVAKQTELSIWFGIGIVAFYIILSSVLNHTLSFLIWCDLKGDVIKTTTARVLAIKTESAWSGYLWHSIIKDFFPKEKDISRVKILIELKNGEKMYLRTIMSFKRRMLFFETFINGKKADEVKLNYLPKSKLLLSIDDIIVSENKKRIQVIEKINYSL